MRHIDLFIEHRIHFCLMFNPIDYYYYYHNHYRLRDFDTNIDGSRDSLILLFSLICCVRYKNGLVRFRSILSVKHIFY